MNAGNLGTVFSTHILCPRKLAPESLQSNHQLFSRAVTFMIGTIAFILEVPTGQNMLGVQGQGGVTGFCHNTPL